MRSRDETLTINWRKVKSSNVERVGWDNAGNMYVSYTGSGKLYKYVGVSRQRVVACARSASVGRYIQRKIKGHYKPIHIDL